MNKQGKAIRAKGGAPITPLNRKKAFRQAIQDFLSEHDELASPDIAQLISGFLIHDSKTGEHHLLRLKYGYYTTGTYCYIARYNDPEVPVNKLDEELYLDLVHESGDRLVYRGQVQLRCSKNRVVLRVENSAPNDTDGQRVPTVFEGIREYRSASYEMNGFATLVDLVFRRLLDQSSESAKKSARVVPSKGGSGVELRNARVRMFD